VAARTGRLSATVEFVRVRVPPPPVPATRSADEALLRACVGLPPDAPLTVYRSADPALRRDQHADRDVGD
jgi:hypothetical protein